MRLLKKSNFYKLNYAAKTVTALQNLDLPVQVIMRKKQKLVLWPYTVNCFYMKHFIKDFFIDFIKIAIKTL